MGSPSEHCRRHGGVMLTLGWGVLDWMRTWLVVPDGTALGAPFEATDEQALAVLRLYEVDGEGRRMVRRGQLMWPKGMGKSPLVGGLALAEAKGPTRFVGWGRDGQPVGEPHPSPWVQVAGVSQDAAVNTWAAMLGMVDPHNGSPFTGRYPDVDVGLTRIFVSNGRLEPVTAAAGTRRGQRVTFAVLDESALWVRANGGLALASTIRDNVTKMGGVSVETTNAFVPGRDSVAERTFQARDTPGVLVDARSSPILVESLKHTRRLRRRLEDLYGSSSWIDLDRLVEEAQDPDVDVAQWRRMFSNELTAESDQWVSESEWAACGRPGVTIPDGATVAVGFDGSRFDDSTALVAVGVDEPVVELIGLWERPPGADAWEVPYDLVDEAVAAMHERFDVARFYCDPPHWADRIDAWGKEWPSVAAWETYRPRPMAAAVDRTETAIRSGVLVHGGDARLTRHILNTRFDLNRFGKRLRKDFPKSSSKIDAAVAMCLAVEARADVIASGATKRAYRVAGF